MHIRSTQIGILRKSIGLHLTGMALQDLLQMRIICIKDTLTALPKQQALTVNIICQILMLIRSDMIRLQIGKDTIIKNKAADTVKHQSL